jgi:choice-of-anchor B domain-containing protein
MQKFLLPLMLFLVSFSALTAQNFNLVQRSNITFPGETCANICGYAQNGLEYALIGCSKGIRIVNVTDPDNPVVITQIPGPNNLWKEIKVWKNYAYITTEANGGALQIIDLSGLPSATVPLVTYKGDGVIANQLSKIHALHIDTTSGFVHLFGATMSDGTAIGDVVLDIKTNPIAPIYVGKWDASYIHDGYVNNDTLYGSHIYAGYFSVIDFKNKANPVLLATTHTPGNFTHNTWPTADGKHILTTDEVDFSFLTSYDVSDFGNIVEVDRFQTTPGSGSVVHNTHVRDGKYAVTSWYHDGVSIVDCSRPGNLIEVGRFDMDVQNGGGTDATWGVYPFLPSGNLVCSGIDEGLFVLTPTWKSACFLEGICTNAVTTFKLQGVSVVINAPHIQSETSRSNGKYATGSVDAGNYSVTFSKTGYISQTISVDLLSGQVTVLDVAMQPQLTITGKAVEQGTSTPIGATKVVFQADDATGNLYETIADANGNFTVSGISPGNYIIFAGKWGYRNAKLTVTLPSSNLIVELKKGYQDDFFADLGWTKNMTATTGFWVRAEPAGTSQGGTPSNTDFDLPNDFGVECYVTGNAGGTAAADDVDGGEVNLISPTMDLTNLTNPKISFHYWFTNAGGSSTPNDHFEAWISNGFTEVKCFESAISVGEWKFSDSISVKNLIAPTNLMTIRFRTADDAPGHLVEAAVDGFWVGDGAIVGISDDFSEKVGLEISPNPFSESAKIKLNIPENSTKITVRVFDIAGREIEVLHPNFTEKTLFIGEKWQNGTYFLQIEADGLRGKAEKLVKF